MFKVKFYFDEIETQKQGCHAREIQETARYSSLVAQSSKCLYLCNSYNDDLTKTSYDNFH